VEWVALGVWLLVAGLALPLAALGALGAPSLALQSLAAIGGLAVLVVYIALNGGPAHRALLWVALALGVVGALAVAKGAEWLMSDDRSVSPAGQSGEEAAALLAGAQGPMFAVAAAVVLLPALNIGVTVH
jgi:hypothetical protein